MIPTCSRKGAPTVICQYPHKIVIHPSNSQPTMCVCTAGIAGIQTVNGEQVVMVHNMEDGTQQQQVHRDPTHYSYSWGHCTCCSFGPKQSPTGIFIVAKQM